VPVTVPEPVLEQSLVGWHEWSWQLFFGSTGVIWPPLFKSYDCRSALWKNNGYSTQHLFHNCFSGV